MGSQRSDWLSKWDSFVYMPLKIDGRYSLRSLKTDDRTDEPMGQKHWTLARITFLQRIFYDDLVEYWDTLLNFMWRDGEFDSEKSIRSAETAKATRTALNRIHRSLNTLAPRTIERTFPIDRNRRVFMATLWQSYCVRFGCLAIIHLTATARYWIRWQDSLLGIGWNSK